MEGDHLGQVGINLDTWLNQNNLDHQAGAPDKRIKMAMMPIFGEIKKMVSAVGMGRKKRSVSAPAVVPKRGVADLARRGLAYLRETEREYDLPLLEKQLKKTIVFVRTHRHLFAMRAEDPLGSLYLKPCEINDYMTGLEGKKGYRGLHVQMNGDGSVYIIPKDPAGFLGSGAFKWGQLALELGPGGSPKRVVAKMRVSMKRFEKNDREAGVLSACETLGDSFKSDQLMAIVNEVTLIRETLARRKKEINFHESDLRCFLYMKGAIFEKADFFLPYCNSGTLQQPIEDKKERLRALLGAAKEIQALHRGGYVNCDVKPSNFLVNKGVKGQMRIHCFDLSFSYIPPEDRSQCKRAGTPIFNPPEMWIRGQPFDPFQAEIFSLGLTFAFIEKRSDFPLSPLPPWLAIAFDGRRGDHYRKRWKEAHRFLYAHDSLELLIRAMMHPIPALRPDIDTVVKALEKIRSGTSEKSLSKFLGHQKGLAPKDYGRGMAYRLFHLKSNPTLIRNELVATPAFVYSISDLTDFRHGFEQSSVDLDEERAKIKQIFLRHINVLISEKMGVRTPRAFKLSDCRQILSGLQRSTLQTAIDLIGKREGHWTLYRNLERELHLLYYESGEYKTILIRSQMQTSPGELKKWTRLALVHAGLKPRHFVPKLCPLPRVDS